MDLTEEEEDARLLQEENEAREKTIKRAAFLNKMRLKKVAVARAQITSEIYGEQPHVPGVDPGLRIWIKVREQQRGTEAAQKVELPMTYPTRIKYDNRTYWMEETHKEWRLMIAEALAEKEAKEVAIREALENAQKEAEEAEAEEAALLAFLESESAEERKLREDTEKKDTDISVKESVLMAKEDEESTVINTAHNMWVVEEMASRATTAAADGEIKEMAVQYHDDGTKIRLNEDGTMKEDRGVYGMLPLLDPKLPRRNPGLTVAQFMNHWKYSNDTAGTLLLAFNHYHWKYMEFLMEAAGPSAQNMLNMELNLKNRRTLLHIAVLNGDAPRVRWLLDHGASPHVKDIRGDTPLMISMDHDVFIHYHDVAIAADILRSRATNKARGAKMTVNLVNTANKRGVTALHRSVLLGALDYIKLLLRNKAKVNVFDNNNKMAIQYCKEDWEQEVHDIFNDNVRFVGKKMHQEMWAHMMSRDFVKSIFQIVVPICSICKRKQYDCAFLKKNNFRYWVYTHQLSSKG